jgi:uncharacterized Zn-binding protein involved in type VI secretion
MGCPTVLIGGLPASRIGDSHVCPMVTGIVPHVGGPFILGSFTVLVGGMPQSRVGDMLICVGPPDTAAMGQNTVLVGMAGAGGFGGLMMGLAMAVGAVLARLLQSPSAYPVSILQADGTYVTECGPAIIVKGTPQFQAQVVDRINVIAKTDSGQETLDAVNNSGKSMTIIEYTGDNSFCGANQTWADVAGQTPKGQPVYDGQGNPIIGPDGKTPLMGTGEGANTTLQLNPNLTLPNSLAPTNPMPNDAILMHEMTHGAHQMNGEADMSPIGGGWDTQEEKTTISSGSPSEAEYLEESGYPYHRTDHDSTFEPN